MKILQFMPWCRIDKRYTVGKVNILPFRSGEPMSRADDATISQMSTIMACYRDLDGHPINEAAVLQFDDRPLISELSDEELEETHEWVELACFPALAKRELFNALGPYCNTDCFTLYSQRCDEPGFIKIRSRRRDGRTYVVHSLPDTVFTVPVHVSPIDRVSLDEGLLDALVAFRKEASEDVWSRWQNAISCFNQANTDSHTVRYQVEWVLLCSAIERILEARSNYSEIAQKFAAAVVPATPLLTSQAKRRLKRWTDMDKSLRYEWMKEFCRIRGDFAHGQLMTRQPAVWIPLEHIILASIAFPLVIRCLLKNARKYAFTHEDQAQLDAFEKLADEQFLNPPANQKHSLDSLWSRLRQTAKSELRKQKIVEHLKASGLWHEESKLI